MSATAIAAIAATWLIAGLAVALIAGRALRDVSHRYPRPREWDAGPDLEDAGWVWPRRDQGGR